MLSQKVLDWYDRSARSFPWRAVHPDRPNPYYVWLSEVMLQQTTTTTVVPYFNQFINRWPSVQELADASLDEVLHAWAGLGYYSRARNLHKAAKLLSHHFPQTEPELLSIPGVGPYTAAAIAAIAFDAPTAPVDGNIARIFSRLYMLDDLKPVLFKRVHDVLTTVVPVRRNGDFVQALMDIGATICTPKKPDCATCPLSRDCLSYQKLVQEQYPFKAPKKQIETRYGMVYWIEDKRGKVLIRRRPEKGLLGGMMEFPGTEWESRKWDESSNGTSGEIKGEVHHTFTHFHLRLMVIKRDSESTSEGVWVSPEEFKNYALPTVMKKVARLVLSS